MPDTETYCCFSVPGLPSQITTKFWGPEARGHRVGWTGSQFLQGSERELHSPPLSWLLVWLAVLGLGPPPSVLCLEILNFIPFARPSFQMRPPGIRMWVTIQSTILARN